MTFRKGGRRGCFGAFFDRLERSDRFRQSGPVAAWDFEPYLLRCWP